MAIDELVSPTVSEPAISRDESLFARDIDGQLVRVVQATAKDLDTDITLLIDGHDFKVKKAVAKRDSQGKILLGPQGEVIPRATTIYDAVTEFYSKSLNKANPIPVLCHRDHLEPVGVCRVCMVEVAEVRKSGRARTALVPSCTYHVKDKMIIRTVASDHRIDDLNVRLVELKSNAKSDQNDSKIKSLEGETKAIPVAVEKIKRSVGLVVELLATEHLDENDFRSINDGLAISDPNELKRLVQQFVDVKNERTRFEPSELFHKRGQDKSSDSIVVDHDACVMCQRCTRACIDIKHNNVISRTGKGYPTKISFDLDLSMQESSCVSCGECVISCPTNALTFKEDYLKVQIGKRKKHIEEEKNERRDRVVIEPVTLDELLEDELFSSIPKKYLEFNGAAVVRKKLPAGTVLCEQGDYGSTAYLIKKGKFEIIFSRQTKQAKKAYTKNNKNGYSNLWGLLGNQKQSAKSKSVTGFTTGSDTQDFDLNNLSERLYRTPADIILGEQACLNRQRRTATIIAAEDSEVIEIGANVLYMLQRNIASRKVLNDVYKKYAMNSQLEKLEIFNSIVDSGKRIRLAKLLANNVELVAYDPGTSVFKEGGQGIDGDDFYLVRMGYVKISRKVGSRDQVVDYRGPGSAFGEIAPLTKIYEGELTQKLEKYRYRPGVRTASCSALDHVELVRIPGALLKSIADENPEFKESLLNRAEFLLDRDSQSSLEISSVTSDFVEQGLYNAQSLLVLDLESCTRCDECTRACADAHDGKSRLVREGLRFGSFLVATSCRSCTDPYCLVGCPVNSIFRDETMEIQIEDHCIGCGLCATNCPYGNITMYGETDSKLDTATSLPVVRQKATTCDQCSSIDKTPRCVYACPHDAAHRMTGEELKKKVLMKDSAI